MRERYCRLKERKREREETSFFVSSETLRLAVIIAVAVGAFLALTVLVGTLGAFCCARFQRSKLTLLQFFPFVCLEEEEKKKGDCRALFFCCFDH